MQLLKQGRRPCFSILPHPPDCRTHSNPGQLGYRLQIGARHSVRSNLHPPELHLNKERTSFSLSIPHADSFFAIFATCCPWYLAAASSFSDAMRSPLPPAIVEAP